MTVNNKEEAELDEIVRELEYDLNLDHEGNLPVPYGYEEHKLVRSKKRKVIGGVFGGLADYFMMSDFSLFMLRIIAVLSVLVGFGSPMLLYIAAWFLMPKEDK